MEQPKDEHMEIICDKSNDRPDQLTILGCIAEERRTDMLKMRQQIAMVTTAFISFGIIFLHLIVHPSHTLSRKWWIPFCIFLSVSIIYWYTIRLMLRYYILFRHEFYSILRSRQKVSSSAEDGMQSTEKNEKKDQTASFIGFCRQIIVLFGENRYMIVVLVAMSAFTFLMLFACYSFLHG